ncbi:MAG: DUF1080 domain-containing protein [Vicinamibacteria bacterium]
MNRTMIRSAIAAGALSMTAAAAIAADAGWTVLFDGKSTEAWRPYGKGTPITECGWAVTGGTLHALPDSATKCDLTTRASFADFDLELEWKVSPGGNSGVMYDVAETEKPSYHTGPEMQVLDDGGHPDGKNPKTSAGSLYALVAPTGKTLKPVGEWNQARLVKKGAHVEHWLNGAKVAEYELGSPALTALIADSKFKDMPRFAREGKGRIVLQHHGQEVWFRNVRVKTP